MSVSEKLCLSCGLCCDGALFKKVSLGATDQLDTLRAVGIEVFEEEKGRWLRQPCAAYKNGKCNIYDKRPKHCLQFQCKLLKRVIDDETIWKEALQLVQTTLRHKVRVESKLDSAMRNAGRNDLSGKYEQLLDSIESKADPSAFRKRYADVLLDYVSLTLQIDRHFKEEK